MLLNMQDVPVLEGVGFGHERQLVVRMKWSGDSLDHLHSFGDTSSQFQDVVLEMSND